MTQQQRNGRIDRYGQPQQPQIRYLLSCSRSEGMGHAEKVLRLLKRKDEQAQQNIGDPAVFLGVYDAVGEEEEISKAFESGTVDALERQMEANAEPYRRQSNGDSLFDELFGSGSEDAAEPAQPATVAQPSTLVHQRQPFSLSPDLRSYVATALEEVAQQMERRGEKLNLRAFPDQQRLEITPVPSWNTSGICTHWWIGWRIGARSASRAIVRRCCSSVRDWIRARW